MLRINIQTTNTATIPKLLFICFFINIQILLTKNGAVKKKSKKMKLIIFLLCGSLRLPCC